MQSTLSKVSFCRKLEKLLKIRVLEHDSEIIRARMNDTVNYDSKSMLSLYHKLFDSKKSKPLKLFIDYYKLLVSCYRHLISQDLFKIHTKNIRISNKQTTVFDKIEINNEIIKTFLEIYECMYPFYYNIHNDITTTFNLIKLPKIEIIKYNLIQNDNIGVDLPTKIINTTDDENIINEYINEIYMFRMYSKKLNETVAYLEQLMENNNINTIHNISIKSFVDKFYIITNNKDDIINKNIFTLRYNEWNNSTRTFMELISDIKKVGIIYDKNKKIKGECGFLIGMRAKQVNINRVNTKMTNNNTIYMF